MLITLSYLYLWVRFNRGYAALLRDTLARLQRSPGRLSFSFSRCSSPVSPLSSPQRQGRSRRQGREGGTQGGRAAEDRGVFLQRGDKAVYVTEPQACCDLSQWTVLPSSVSAPHRDISFIIEASGPRAARLSPRKTRNKSLSWADLCVPLAQLSSPVPGQSYRALAQASVEEFSSLGVAFIEDRLQLQDDLRPNRIIPVRLEESALTTLLQHGLKSLSPLRALTPPSSLHLLSVDEPLLVCRKGSLFLLPEPRLEERRGSEPPSNLGLLCDQQNTSQHNMEEHGHSHLHLSSCHECLELENSTILSVKFASVENIPDLPDDSSMHIAGDDVSETAEDDFATPGCDVPSKPPNILVFTGDNESHFQTLRGALSKCINLDNYMIYPLSSQQALSDPWLDYCCLLVVAERDQPLSAHLQTRFLTFLCGGGKVLGLSSALCPAGVSLSEGQRGELGVRTLSFTREDSSSMEFPVRVSGRVYQREVLGGGEVELWGELTQGQERGAPSMVIIRVTHGEDTGGEAVLCQVHLEEPTEKLPSEGPDCVEVHDDLRYEVLTEILTSLGVSCEQSQAAKPSPVHLLTVTPEARSEFVKWLRAEADERGLLPLPKASLRLVSRSAAEAESEMEEGAVSLLWDCADSPSPGHFSLRSYRSHLRTERLGHTVLYADVVSSTMDLLDGLNLRVPADVGLVAVAARQNQGKGRSKNGWLSPLGCAMFTVSLQVEVSSRLGQRIPFLQHLMALAVVEAVRTLPGYQDIDLRVKWPNDIYCGDGRKLGGVLVTSTMMGSTFYLLIGCGFNVYNSAPTVCINDLIQRHNQDQGSSLQPLSCDVLIARSINILEKLISDFQRDGPEAVLPTYYNRWLHSGTRVRLWNEEGPEVDVVGLDQNGFLQVHSAQSGLLSLEPDGNSFDMLKNLLVMKTQ